MGQWAPGARPPVFEVLAWFREKQDTICGKQFEELRRGCMLIAGKTLETAWAVFPELGQSARCILVDLSKVIKD